MDFNRTPHRSFMGMQDIWRQEIQVRNNSSSSCIPILHYFYFLFFSPFSMADAQETIDELRTQEMQMHTQEKELA